MTNIGKQNKLAVYTIVHKYLHECQPPQDLRQDHIVRKFEPFDISDITSVVIHMNRCVIDCHIRVDKKFIAMDNVPFYNHNHPLTMSLSFYQLHNADDAIVEYDLYEKSK